jgi:hypothetical protein
MIFGTIEISSACAGNITCFSLMRDYTTQNLIDRAEE